MGGVDGWANEGFEFGYLPVYVVIHTVQVFNIVNEVDVFLEFPCFFYDPVDVGSLISVSSASSNSSLYIS